MENKLTPLQEAIYVATSQTSFVLHDEGFYRAKKQIIDAIKNLLPKEQQLLSDTWDAAIITCMESGGPADDFIWTKETYLSQFKHEYGKANRNLDRNKRK